jgi:peptidoglycan/LPS O-acetylase OafA/YrhL
MRLSDFTSGKDNNFNLIRIVAAYAVLLSHSFALAVGSPDAEPLRHALGTTFGLIAVDVFFITSGFLVTASFLTRQNVVEFVWARVLRIFPALLVMLLLTVLGLGLFFTKTAWSFYLTDRGTYRYFLKCVTLVLGVEYNLPGVFENNPYKHAVNGSLWTLPGEIRMYAILALLWVGLCVLPKFRQKAFRITLVLCSAVSGLFVVLMYWMTGKAEVTFWHLFFMFYTGAAFYVARSRITLSPGLFWCALAVLGLSVQWRPAFPVVYMMTMAYVLLFLAYVPSGFLRRYNRLGDYSYGVYIYAFPVQQSIAALLPGVSVGMMLAISAVATLLCAYSSWHLVEKHALRLKTVPVSRMLGMLGWRGLFERHSETPMGS